LDELPNLTAGTLCEDLDRCVTALSEAGWSPRPTWMVTRSASWERLPRACNRFSSDWVRSVWPEGGLTNSREFG